MSTHDSFEERALSDPDFRFGAENYDMLTKVGELLRAMRREAGLTQQQLQDASGVGQAYISRAERGEMERGPSLELVTRMAHASGYSLVLSLRKQGASPESGAMMIEL